MMTDEEQEQFWRKIQSIVEKDVVRTDRSHPYFRGDDNPNIEVLKYAILVKVSPLKFDIVQITFPD